MNGWQAAVTALCVVTGTVYDSQHHPVPAVRVYLQSADKKEVTAQTDAAGIYRFSVPSGTYTVRAEGETSTIKAEPNRTTTADLTAQPAFFDEPKYMAAGVTDYTYRGGHGSDTVFRSAQTMAKALEGEHASVGDAKEASLYERGTELLSHRKAREAAEVFLKGIQLFPQSVRMLLGMASSCYAEGAYDESAKWFYKATDLAPNDPKPYLFLGRVQARQITESSGYKERMARFAKLQPDSALANYYYGTTLSDERARDLFQKAVRLDPQLAPAHVRLASLAARDGNYAEAIRDYQAAIAADPEMEEAHYRLSEAYRLTGDAAKAKEELAIFQRLSKESAARE
jgi:tetratricopeptide (TPR) repeat protein